MDDNFLKYNRFPKILKTDEASFYHRHLSRKSKKDQLIEGNIIEKRILT